MEAGSPQAAEAVKKNSTLREVGRSSPPGIVTGQMSKRALHMLFEWLEMHRENLMENWNSARERKPLKQIAPLD